AAEEAARTAERVQHEIARIEPALHGDLVDEVCDLRAGDAIDAERGFLHRHAERVGDLALEDAARALDIELDGTAEERAGVHIADQEQNVGQRWLSAALSVADGTGAGAGAARAHE